jgi:lysylphosphatidylglycerol synthetase-like protein (DUF2156 family)
MKPFSILLIKLLGLYLGLNALFSMLPLLLSPNFNELWSGEWLPLLIATLGLPMVGGVALWFMASTIANKLHGETASTLSVTDDDMVRAGTFLIGIYLFVQHIGIVISRYTAAGDIAYGSLFVVVLSLVMLLGTGVFARLYLWAKYMGNNR